MTSLPWRIASNIIVVKSDSLLDSWEIAKCDGDLSLFFIEQLVHQVLVDANNDTRHRKIGRFTIDTPQPCREQDWVNVIHVLVVVCLEYLSSIQIPARQYTISKPKSHFSTYREQFVEASSCTSVNEVQSGKIPRLICVSGHPKQLHFQHNIRWRAQFIPKKFLYLCINTTTEQVSASDLPSSATSGDTFHAEGNTAIGTSTKRTGFI